MAHSRYHFPDGLSFSMSTEFGRIVMEIPATANLVVFIHSPAELIGDNAKCFKVLIEFNNHEDDTQRIRRLVDWLCPAVKELAFDKVGCHLLQAVLDHVVLHSDKKNILKSLLPCFEKAYESPHANHVLQKLIKLLPVHYLNGVIKKVAGNATTMARHQYGSRVLERLIEHFSEPALDTIRDEIAGDSKALCQDRFGNYVVKQMLAGGSHKNREEVLGNMLPSLPALAGHHFARHVVYRLLDKCKETGQQKRMVDELLKGEGKLSLLEVAKRYKCCEAIDRLERDQFDGANGEESSDAEGGDGPDSSHSDGGRAP